VLALLLLLVPLIVMSLTKDRYQRYLAPLAPAGRCWQPTRWSSTAPAGPRDFVGQSGPRRGGHALAAARCMTALVPVLVSTGRCARS